MSLSKFPLRKQEAVVAVEEWCVERQRVNGLQGVTQGCSGMFPGSRPGQSDCANADRNKRTLFFSHIAQSRVTAGSRSISWAAPALFALHNHRLCPSAPSRQVNRRLQSLAPLERNRPELSTSCSRLPVLPSQVPPQASRLTTGPRHASGWTQKGNNEIRDQGGAQDWPKQPAEKASGQWFRFQSRLLMQRTS